MTVAVRSPRRQRLAAEPFTVEHFAWWAAKLVLDTGGRWELEDFQRGFLDDVFAGFRECWLVVPEENTKTTTLAGLGLYHLDFRGTASVPIAASSREQAEVMYRQAEGFVLRSDHLRLRFKCQEGYRRIKCLENLSRMQVFAADDRTGDGIIPTLALLDELHRHRDLRLYRTWAGKLGKRGGQIATISTAGEPGGEFELTRERIRQAADELVRDGSFVRAVAGSTVLHEWAVPEDGDVEDMVVVKAANPFSGVTVGSLEEKFGSPTMTLPHWRRFVCNLPTRASNAAIQEAEWFDAETDQWAEPGTPVWCGLDLGWKWDTTAIVPLWVPEDGPRVLGRSRVLTPPRDGSSLDPHLVEMALSEIHETNPIHTVVMDMTKGEQLAAWIEAELGAVVIDRGTGNAAAVEDYQRFTEGLRTGQLKHAGCPDLTRHVLNAVARMLPKGDARFDRSSQTRQASAQDSRVIDALTAAAMVNALVGYEAPSWRPM